MAFSLLPAAAPRAAAAPDLSWPLAQYNPNPLPDDLLVPLPCGGAMAFRPVATGAPPAGLPADLQRLYRVAGRFDPARTGTGHLLIGKYEVTRLQYRSVEAVTRGRPCPAPDLESALPQVEVNRRDAEGFGLDLSQWLADRAGTIPDCAAAATPCLPRVDGVAATVRLPGEDEWAFAARGGLAVGAADFAARTYPMPQGLARGVIGKREGGSAAAPIGGARANPLGLYDMLGNVEEIMLDLYRADGAAGEIGGYVVRGGSFYTERGEMTASLRREVPLLNKTSDTGFRVVAAVPIFTSARRLSEVARRSMQSADSEAEAPVGPEVRAAVEAQLAREQAEAERKMTLGSEAKRALLAQARALAEQERAAQVAAFEEFFPMVELPGWTFWMGCSTGDRQCEPNEEPAHWVTVHAFRIGKHEVSQGQWRAVMGENPAYYRGDDRPVENVSWSDVQAFLARLNAKAPGKPYRLPTEAEWEYAARGTRSTPYWWGSEIGRGNANCAECGSEWDGQSTAPVGSFQPNPFGLYETLGNVWEWVQDCWHDSYQGAPQDGSAWREGCADGQFVLRGGSQYNNAQSARVSQRGGAERDSRFNNLGLRLAQDL